MRDKSETGWLALHGARLEGDERRVFGQARAICDAAARYGPWLEREALKLVRGDKARARRMARRALDSLWEWDVTRFSATDDAYLRRALVKAMGAGVRRAHHAIKHPQPERQMPRTSFLLLLAFPLVAARAAAQGFEGTIT
ncbi:MAG: hypothetical protein ACHQQR_14195, partial [Gemmatimonadales bacterium]